MEGEVVTVAIKGVPEGFSLSVGERQPDGSWAVSPKDLQSVQLITPNNFHGDIDLTSNQLQKELSSGDVSVISKQFTVSVADVNDNQKTSLFLSSFVVEDARPGTVIGKLNATDIEGDTLTFKVIGDNASTFEVVDGESCEFEINPISISSPRR